MSEKYSKYYKKIENTRNTFDKLFIKINNLKSKELKNKILQRLLKFLTLNNIGYWTYSDIENFYLDYAQTTDIENYNINYTPNSFLHVITTGHTTGGHTRVVERWIKNADTNQSHSVVILKPNSCVLSELEENTKQKNGKCIYFDNKLSFKDKVLKLRELGLHYQYIILHTHMEDPTAVTAFGTEKFTRPVFLYNHASHLFWIGKGIADLVLDIIKDDKITNTSRNIKNTYFLGVPSKEIIFEKIDKNKLRNKLGFPLDKKIIITSGSDFKYCVIGNDSYADIIEKIIDENTYCYIIGIDKNNKYWQAVEKRTNGHIVPIGYIDFNKGYLDYLSVADLYLDSYPEGGGAAIMDAISRGVCALSLQSGSPQFDYLTKTNAYCLTEDDFISKAKKILTDKIYAETLLNELQTSLNEYQSINAWNKRIEALLQICPKEHKIYRCNEKDYNKIDDLSVLINVMNNKNFLSPIYINSRLLKIKLEYLKMIILDKFKSMKEKK